MRRACRRALARYERSTGIRQFPFDAGRDYHEHVDGKPRHDGVRDFFAARGIALPEGDDSSAPGEWSVHGIAKRKQEHVEQALAAGGVRAFPGSVRWVEQLRDLGVRTAVVSASANSRAVLAAAGIDGMFDVKVDGRDVKRLGMRGKPAPDGFLAAADMLGVRPARAVVVEDALVGVAAGRAGGFASVIGVDRVGHAQALLDHGADRVVTDLEELMR